MYNMPIMFTRCYKCTDENGLKPNVDETNGVHNRVSFVVMMPTYSNPVPYDSTWMNDDKLHHDPANGYNIYLNDIDLVDDKDVFVFDLDDVVESRRQAMLKMQDLWKQIRI